MNKVKLFVENILVYGFGGVISKIIPLIMVPIVTRLMPDSSYFGISDMSNTIMTFTMYFAILGMYDAMYRLFFEYDEENYKRKVCSTTMTFNAFSSLVVFVLMVLLRKPIAAYFLNNEEYAYLIYITALATFVGATNSIVSAPTRMQNKRKIFLVTNTVGPIISYSISIPLLLNGYYLIALPLAGFLSALIIEIVFIVLNHTWFDYRLFDKSLLKQLLIVGVPLLPNFLIYWVFGSCDRLMITKMMGMDYEGLYSVGSKLGLASQLIYTAFAGGWQYFAFYTMKEDNQVQNNSKVFEYLAAISFTSTFFVCALAYPIYRLLFVGDYVGSYIVSPYLFLAPLIQMLYQVAANQFLVIKKTWPMMFILSFGAVANVGCNYLLIPILGIEGASIATLVGYLLSIIICVAVLYKMKLIVLSKQFYVSTLLLLVYFLIWRLVMLDRTLVLIIIAIVFSMLIALLYKNNLLALLKMIKTENNKEE